MAINRLLWVPLTLLVTVALVPPNRSYGEKLYKYRDAEGKLVFSDKQPATSAPVEVRQVDPGKPKRKISLSHRGTKERPTIVAVNDFDGPVEVELRWEEQRNVESSVPLPARFVIPARRELELARLSPVREDQSWGYRYQWTWVPGPPGEAPPQPVYEMPFCGGKFSVSQGFNGSFSHQDPENKYAVDIAMPVGTPLCAARDGVVMEVAGDYYAGGTDRAELMERANFVRILHSDGTMALYAHLMLESVQVLPGQRVSAGQLLGYSGDTGFSSGPHLHFAIQKNIGMKITSIPFAFPGGEPAHGRLLSSR